MVSSLIVNVRRCSLENRWETPVRNKALDMFYICKLDYGGSWKQGRGQLCFSVICEDKIKSQLYTGHGLLIQQGQDKNNRLYTPDICAFLINPGLSFLVYSDLVIKRSLRGYLMPVLQPLHFWKCACVNTGEMNVFIFNICATKLVSACIFLGKACSFGMRGGSKVKENIYRGSNLRIKMLLKPLLEAPLVIGMDWNHARAGQGTRLSRVQCFHTAVYLFHRKACGNDK